MLIEEVQEKLDKKIIEMEDQQCFEFDILDLLRLFSSEIEQLEEIFKEHSNKDGEEIEPAKYTIFITRVEAVVNT